MSDTARDPNRQKDKTRALYGALGFTQPEALLAFTEGNHRFQEENYQQAIKAYTRALDIEAELHPARFERARAARRLGDHKSAIDDYRELYNREVGGAIMRLILVEALVIDGRPIDAADVLQDICGGRMNEETRFFYLVYCAACMAGISGDFQPVLRDWPLFVGSVKSKPLRPTWFTLTTLRDFLGRGGLTPEFREWFRTEVEPVLDDHE